MKQETGQRTRISMPIAIKLSAVFSLVIACIALFIFVFFPARQERQAISANKERIQSIVTMTAANISSALYFDDAEAIAEMVEGAAINEDLLYLVVKDDSGNTAYVHDATRDLEPVLDEIEAVSGVHGEVERGMVPIVLQEKRIGELHFGFSLHHIHSRIRDSRLLIAGVSGAIVLLGIVAAILFSALLTRPLASMVRAANAIERGDLSQRAEVRTQDELGHLAENFNAMIANLQSAQEELKRANAQLEYQADELQQEITQRTAVEAQQADTLKELEAANQELKDFAYVVSHDLKAPLRGIGSLSAWLVGDYGDALGDEGKEMLDLLAIRASRMQQLIDGVLQYSHVGRVREEKQEVALLEIVEGVVDLLAPSESFSIVLPDEMPTVLFEPTRIHQVFQNLLSNAIKYNDKEHGRVEVTCEDGGDAWVLGVADNGPGIDPKYFERIFMIFQTLDEKDDVESTGIGLTIMKKIVEMYGGRIWVESEVGVGTTFFFTIPKEEGSAVA